MIDVLITPRLSKAARALLNWQQKDLAEHAGLSLTAIKAFEKEASKSRHTTKLLIQSTLESHGIEFLKTGGLRPTDDISAISLLKGADFFKNFYNDIYLACTHDHQDLLTSSVDQKMWWHPSIKELGHEFEAWVKKRKIKMRTLTTSGKNTLRYKHALYRAVPPEILGKITYCIYADRLAFILWKKRQILLIRNKSIVETFRGQFNSLWKLGKVITK